MARVLRGPPFPGELPLVPLHEYALDYMNHYGDRIWLTNITKDKTYTYNDVADMIKRLAVAFESQGCSKGDVIAMYALNSEEFIIVLLASLCVGMTVGTINPAATVYELSYYLKEIRPQYVFTESVLLQKCKDAVTKQTIQPVIILREEHDVHLNVPNLLINTTETGLRNPPELNVEDDVAIILFSSGTTGLPKGVLLSHHSIVSNSDMMTKGGYLPRECSSLLNSFPMYHMGGFIILLSSMTLRQGLYFQESYNLEMLLQAIERYQIDFLAMPPTVVLQMSKTPLLDKYDVTSVRCCVTGAAPAKDELFSLFVSRFNNCEILQGYGMTETAGIVSFRATDKMPISSIGHVCMGCEIKIVDPESGELLGPNVTGEIVMRAPFLMKGYWNKPEATRQTLKEGWLFSGDLGYYDDNNHIYIVDRLKDLIKYKANQVAPAELEAALLEHPDVTEAGVIGVPDADAGEVPRAYVVKRENARLTEEQVQQFIKERMSYYKWLRGGVVFISELPKLASGKILRRELRIIAQKSKL